MAVNQYSTPAEARFINTYVPIPFEQLNQAAATRQAKHDTNLAGLDAARAGLANINYIPDSQDEVYVRNALHTMDEISDQFVGADLSDPEQERALRNAMRTQISGENLRKIQTSHGMWEQNQKIKADLKRQGKYHEALDADPWRGYNTLGEQGVYNYQTEALLDSRRAAEQYFNNLRANQMVSEDGTSLISGVSQADIDRAASGNLRNFIDTNEGRQAVKLAAYRSGIDYDSLNQQQREGLADQYLRDVGQEFKYTQMTPLTGSRGSEPGSSGDNRIRLTTTRQGAVVDKEYDFLEIGKLRDHDFNEDGSLGTIKTVNESSKGVYTNPLTGVVTRQEEPQRIDTGELNKQGS